MSSKPHFSPFRKAQNSSTTKSQIPRRPERNDCRQSPHPTAGYDLACIDTSADLSCFRPPDPTPPLRSRPYLPDPSSSPSNSSCPVLIPLSSPHPSASPSVVAVPPARATTLGSATAADDPRPSRCLRAPVNTPSDPAQVDVDALSGSPRQNAWPWLTRIPNAQTL
jgi:hypothetical protein